MIRYRSLPKKLSRLLTATALLLGMFVSVCEAGKPSQVYFAIWPKLIDRPSGNPLLAIVFSKIDITQKTPKPRIFGMEPEIEGALFRNTENSTGVEFFDIKNKFRRQNLPAEIGDFLASQFEKAGVECGGQPLFPLFSSPSASLAIETCSPALRIQKGLSPSEALYVKSLIAQFSSESLEASFETAFMRICREFGISVENAWFFPELNLLVVESDEKFQGLIQALFSVGSLSNGKHLAP